MQKDAILLLPLCSMGEITQCDDSMSKAKVMNTNERDEITVKMVDGGGFQREQHICELAVPAACPRIQCFNEGLGKFMPCRIQGLVQSRVNGSGCWVKLPCAECDETRKLHPTTEGFYYGEDAARD